MLRSSICRICTGLPFNRSLHLISTFICFVLHHNTNQYVIPSDWAIRNWDLESFQRPHSLVGNRIFFFGRETRRGNSFFIQSYEISGNKVGNPGSLLPSTCSMRLGWHLWFYSCFRSWFVHRWHVVRTCFDFARQVDREEVLILPIVLSSIHKSTRS